MLIHWQCSVTVMHSKSNACNTAFFVRALKHFCVIVNSAQCHSGTLE